MATHMWRNAIREGCGKLCRKRCIPHRRRFCSNTENADVNSIPLSQPVPGLLLPKVVSTPNLRHDTQVTTLQNGLRVASEKVYGQFSTVGVVIDSGSRYEVAYPSGISHFLEKLAFRKTTEYKNPEAIHNELDKVGGICDAQGSRDTFIYATSIQTSGLPQVIKLLSEVVHRIEIDEQALELARATVGYELESIQMNPNPELLLLEMIHGAAYRENTLGLPRLCPAEQLPKIDSRALYTYLKNFHTPERMVLAGVGMEHDVLVGLAEEYFCSKKPIWEEDSVSTDPARSTDTSIAQYTGGLVKVDADLSSVSLGPTPMPELAHFVIGLESSSHQVDDFIPYCVLNMLLGGGGSFSAGGPGKGMYARMYLNVLNKYSWIHSATTYNFGYMDSGLFCVHASSHPSQLGNLVDVITKELVNAAGYINEVELSRAKMQLKSMMLMNLEMRPLMFEDVGRQVLSSDIRRQPEHYCNLIDKVTDKDIVRVAEQMLRTKPAVAAYGSLDKLPSMDDINSAILQKPGGMGRRFSFFR